MIDKNKGKLYIVGTPIGNLDDITIRAVNTLRNVDVILAEDTRQTLKLLNHFEISKHMISYHRHNEDDNIEVVPGVTALITAIVKSGLDSTRFTFEGFLSVNKKQRKERLKSLVNETRTMIFYEAPHKILSTLKDMYEYFGNRDICIARELTKIHEEYRYTNFKDAIINIEENGIKGEIVLVISGASEDKINEEKNKEIEQINSLELVKEYMKNGDTKKDAIKKVAKLKGVNKDVVYKECLDI